MKLFIYKTFCGLVQQFIGGVKRIVPAEEKFEFGYYNLNFTTVNALDHYGMIL